MGQDFFGGKKGRDKKADRWGGIGLSVIDESVWSGKNAGVLRGRRMSGKGLFLARGDLFHFFHLSQAGGFYGEVKLSVRPD